MQPREQGDTGIDVGSNETAHERTSADPERSGRLRGRCLAARGLAAGLLLAVAGLLALPLPAQAQSKILVSNVGQSSAGHGSLLEFDQAQAFTTGSNSAGYTLTRVEISMQIIYDNARGTQMFSSTEGSLSMQPREQVDTGVDVGSNELL